jgi:hypothetical protein
LDTKEELSATDVEDPVELELPELLEVSPPSLDDVEEDEEEGEEEDEDEDEDELDALQDLFFFRLEARFDFFVTEGTADEPTISTTFLLAMFLRDVEWCLRWFAGERRPP